MGYTAMALFGGVVNARRLSVGSWVGPPGARIEKEDTKASPFLLFFLRWCTFVRMIKEGPRLNGATNARFGVTLSCLRLQLSPLRDD